MAKKIMVVDDSNFMREMIKDILLKNGYEIAGEAEDSKAACEKYQVLKPDLVTSDIVMRGKSGIDMVKDIVKIDPGAKILMISSMGQQAMIIDAIRAGAKGFVMKPFRPEVLLEEIKRLLGE